MESQKSSTRLSFTHPVGRRSWCNGALRYFRRLTPRAQRWRGKTSVGVAAAVALSEPVADDEQNASLISAAHKDVVVLYVTKDEALP